MALCLNGCYTNPELFPNQYSCNTNFYFIDIQNPAGVGFNVGYRGEYLNDKIAGDQEEAFVLNFYKAFPKYLNHELYITEESYGRIYVPYLAYNLHPLGHTTKTVGDINLVGISIKI